MPHENISAVIPAKIIFFIFVLFFLVYKIIDRADEGPANRKPFKKVAVFR